MGKSGTDDVSPLHRHFSALPTGAVTFLLTDVENSTRLWAERSDEMGSAIARHYELLDEVISAAAGLDLTPFSE